MAGHIKQALQKGLGRFGYEIRRKRPEPEVVERPHLAELLERTKGLGFTPKTVFDVGIKTGTPGLYDVFDDVQYVLIDPLQENEIFMRHICSRHKNAVYVVAAAGEEPGEAQIHIPLDFNGSLYTKSAEGAARTIPVTTIDRIAEEHGCRGPYVIKSDTEGHELHILRGADGVLQETELVILEVAFFPFSGRPQFFEMAAFMKQRGFVVYDAYDLVYRPLDGALGLADVAFVKEEGIFRTRKSFRTAEQRQANLAKKLQYREQEMKYIEQIAKGAP